MLVRSHTLLYSSLKPRLSRSLLPLMRIFRSVSTSCCSQHNIVPVRLMGAWLYQENIYFCKIYIYIHSINTHICSLKTTYVTNAHADAQFVQHTGVCGKYCTASTDWLQMDWVNNDGSVKCMLAAGDVYFCVCLSISFFRKWFVCSLLS